MGLGYGGWDLVMQPFKFYPLSYLLRSINRISSWPLCFGPYFAILYSRDISAGIAAFRVNCLSRNDADSGISMNTYYVTMPYQEP